MLAARPAWRPRLGAALRPGLRVRPATWLGILLVLACVGVLVYPWSHPANDVDLHRFDPGLLTPTLRGSLAQEGFVTVTPGEVAIRTRPYSQPTLHLLTTEAPDFSASFLVQVSEASGNVFPLQMRLWNPRHNLASEVWMDRTAGLLQVGERAGSSWLRKGIMLHADSATPTFEIRVARAGCTIEWQARTNGGQPAVWQTTCAQFPDLFTQDTLSLSLYSTGLNGANSLVRYTDPHIVTGHQDLYGSGSNDPRLPLVAGLLLLGSLAVLASHIRRFAQTCATWRPRRPGLGVLGAGLTGAALTVLWWASGLLGNHPYDAYAQGAWAYIAQHYGPGAFYPITMISPEGMAHGGDPYHAATMPYPPVFLVLLGACGWLAALWDPAYRPTAPVLEMAIKGLHLLFLITTAAVAGWGFPPARRQLAAVVVFDGGLLLDALIWGQMDAELILCLVGATVALLRGRLALMLALLGLSYLTKQTALLFAPWIVLVAWRRAGTGAVLRAVGPAVAGLCLLMAPLFALGLAPSSLWSPTVHKALQWGTAEHREEATAGVTNDAYNLWPLISGLAGQRGNERLHEADTDRPAPWLPSYATLAHLLVAAVGLWGMYALWRAPAHQWQTTSQLCLFLGLVFLAVPSVMTRMNSRYLLPGIVFLGLAALGQGRARLWAAWALGSVSCLLGIGGLLAQIADTYPNLLPHLAPDTNAPAWVFLQLRSNETVVTLACLAPLVALCLAWAELRPRPARHGPVRLCALVRSWLRRSRVGGEPVSAGATMPNTLGRPKNAAEKLSAWFVIACRVHRPNLSKEVRPTVTRAYERLVGLTAGRSWWVRNLAPVALSLVTAGWAWVQVQTTPVVAAAHDLVEVHVLFGQSLDLLGFTTPPAVVEPGQRIETEFLWGLRTGVPQGGSLHVLLLESDSGAVRARDVALPEERSLPPDKWALGVIIRDLHLLRVPPDLQPGIYDLAIVLQRQPPSEPESRATLLARRTFAHVRVAQ